MNMEESIMDACNEVGSLATEETLQQFDIDGSPIKFGDVKMTAREKIIRYQTPYGAVSVQMNIT